MEYDRNNKYYVTLEMKKGRATTTWTLDAYSEESYLPCMKSILKLTWRHSQLQPQQLPAI
jgi:hypothetical protein